MVDSDGHLSHLPASGPRAQPTCSSDPGQPPPLPSRGGVGGVAPRGVPLSRSSALLDTAAGAALRKEVADAGTADSGRERAMLMARAQAGDREADYRLLEDITPFP